MLCSTHLQNNVQIPSKMCIFAQKWHTTGLGPRNLPLKTPKWPQNPLQVTPMLPKWAKLTSESAQSDSRGSQNEPKCSQVIPRGLPRPLKEVKKEGPRPPRDTSKKMNDSALREPHYLLCFWRVTLREPHYLLCFKHIENPNFPQKWWKPNYLLCFRATEKTCLSKGTGSAFIF